MTGVTLIFGVIFIFWFISEILKDDEEDSINNKTAEQQEYPYTKKLLLTKTEYYFYKELKEKCIESEYIICPKIRMEDFLNVTDKKNKMKYRGYIKSRHIDFILCDKNLYMIAGIELDDKTHNEEKAIKTDVFKDNVFKKINIPLYRIKVSTTYNEELNKMIASIKEFKNNGKQTEPTEISS